MLTISQKLFFVSLDKLALFLGNRCKIVSDRMGDRRGAKHAFATLEIGIRNQIFLENPEVGILIPIN